MINQTDKDLFRNTVESGILIDKDGVSTVENTHNQQSVFTAYRYISTANLTSSEVVIYAQSGVSNKLIKKMKQGNIVHAPMLDLHGQTLVEACKSMAEFIHHHQHQSFIHIIHGKGYHSENGLSLLKTQVVSFLTQHPGVLAFHSCPPKDGGTGAVFVLMKSYV